MAPDGKSYYSPSIRCVVARLASPPITNVVQEVERLNWTGRKGYPARTMVGVAVVRGVYGMRQWSDTLDLLRRDDSLREVVGAVPSQWACYRFAAKLRELGHAELVDVPTYRPPSRRRRRAFTKPQRLLTVLTVLAVRLTEYEERMAEREEHMEAARAAVRAGRTLLPVQHERTLSLELAELVEAQARDIRFGNRVWQREARSLDAPLLNRKGQEFSERWMLASDALDPLRMTIADERSRALDAVLGGMSVETVARLNEHSLNRLQERLRDEGLVPTGVQRKERERLREPVRHRGNAPPPKRGKKSSRHRGRNAQRALMAGRRTSRKQPKRWSRETVPWNELREAVS